MTKLNKFVNTVKNLIFSKITSGAADDLQKVSNIANAIVTKYGMSDLGLRAFASQNEEFMAKPYSPKTEAVIQKLNKIYQF